MLEQKHWGDRMNTRIFVIFLALLGFCSLASAKTIYVPDDYAKIQWAVDNATAWDTIIVRDGTYIENILVNKSLTIMSENGSANCIVQANNSNDHVFNITADNVTIKGFTVKNATGTEKAGIYIYNSNNCTIENVNASNNYLGIYLFNSNNNTIANNTVSNNNEGMRLKSSSNNSIINNTVITNNWNGIYFKDSDNNTIENNTISSNTNHGIRFDSSNNNTIINNTILSNDYGIILEFSDYNKIINNTILSLTTIMEHPS